MPPKKGIIKSGNAGNSSKAPPKGTTLTPPTEDNEKPLFPPGSKYPLSLLHERCQKNSWDKPIVDTFKNKDGWSFAVTLQRANKKTGGKDSVRFQSHPPHYSPSAIEAKHYGATYALFRFCNNIQLNRVLPPGPREYWNQLEVEKKSAPEHQKWMYDVDPFAAKKEVEARQEAVTKKQAKASSDNFPGAGSSSHASRSGLDSLDDFSQIPEVKMAGELRDQVEKAIKTMMSYHPEALDSSFLLDEDARSMHIQQLEKLGFTPVQSRNTLDFLSKPSALASSLLQTSSLLEACLEYLILTTPECNLPQRFLPSMNSSKSMITSMHSKDDDLKTRWMHDKVKALGWPLHCIKACTSTDKGFADDLELLIAALNRLLIGDEWRDIYDIDPSSSYTYSIDEDESTALGASFDQLDPNLLVMPLFSAPINLNIFVGQKRQVHSSRPSLYLTSDSVPAYVRLHLLSLLLSNIKDHLTFLHPGEGFCMASMRTLEAGWASIEDNGPPDMSVVMQHLIHTASRVDDSAEAAPEVFSDPSPGSRRLKKKAPRGDNRSDRQVREDFEVVRESKKYEELRLIREKLPAFAAQDNFLRILETNRAVVVVGETGCGKTTQLPQFILDSLIMADKGTKTSIIVTQPRRLAAISVAARVSAERLDDGSVGYAIRGESKQTNKTKLLFCTTGVVLRRLGSGDDLLGVTHIIVDEVHERSVDSDFLLLELKELLKKHKTLKIVLMSATINHETFVKYLDGCPLVTIPGRTFPVVDVYLEDFLPMIDYRPVARQRRKKNDEQEDDSFLQQLQDKGYDEQTIQAIQILDKSDQLDYSLISSIILHIMENSEKGGILVFLTGVQEIRQCVDTIRQSISESRADVLPLHANLSSDEQRQVFVHTSRWKVIVSTNVAETSITIDDVVYVIDAGKVKESRYEPETGLFRLVETWTTRAAARQRRGRAGRTRSGKCFKLYTRAKEERMEKYPVPEILRVPLETILLTMKVMREDEDPTSYLSRAIDPPKFSTMQTAWSVLEEIGAVGEDGKLTGLGRHIAMIPVDLRLGKMLVLATVFRCLGPMLTIVACVSSKPLFVSPFEKREEATRARAHFASGDSDLLTDLRAYEACMELGKSKESRRSVKAFCEENFISMASLREIGVLRQDFMSALSERGLIPQSCTAHSPFLNANSDNLNLLKSLILVGLWPRVARVHLPKSAIKFDKVQAGTIRRENAAKQFKIFDVKDGRVFMHPSSVLFDKAAWKSPFVAYIQKQATTKVYIRDVTMIPIYALLLFGGPVTVDHVKGGLQVGRKDKFIQLKAWPRIGVLVNQLRKLLDAQLKQCIEDGGTLNAEHGKSSVVMNAILALLSGDGLTNSLE